jgi:hypothetical protein
VTPATAGVLAAWWGRIRAVIDVHDRSEDEVAWRELRRRVPGFAHEEQALRDDHRALHVAAEAVTHALAGRAVAARLPAAADRFDTALRAHLRREEGTVLPLLAIGVSAAGCAAIERQVLRYPSLRAQVFLVPWLLDGADAGTVARVAASTPGPIRVLGSTVGRCDYERTVAPVRALIRGARA